MNKKGFLTHFIFVKTNASNLPAASLKGHLRKMVALSNTHLLLLLLSDHPAQTLWFLLHQKPDQRKISYLLNYWISESNMVNFLNCCHKEGSSNHIMTMRNLKRVLFFALRCLF